MDSFYAIINVSVEADQRVGYVVMLCFDTALKLLACLKTTRESRYAFVGRVCAPQQAGTNETT
jgi:hypothetical protein